MIFRRDFGVLFQHRGRSRFAGRDEFVVERVVGDRKNFRSEICRVLRAVDRDRRNGDAGRHLHRGKKRVRSAETAALDRNADDGKQRIRRDRARQMRRHARRRDQNAESVFPRTLGKRFRFFRRAVRREHVNLVRDPEFRKHAERFFHNGKIAVATHDNRRFFHSKPP